MEVKLSKKEIELIIESLSIYEDEYSGTTDFEENIRKRLEKLQKKLSTIK